MKPINWNKTRKQETYRPGCNYCGGEPDRWHTWGSQALAVIICSACAGRKLRFHDNISESFIEPDMESEAWDE